MSTSGGKKGGGKGPPKESKNEEKEQKDAAKPSKEPKVEQKSEKDETASNGGAGEENAAPSKPPSAGTNVRDAAQKVLTLCQKGEWAPVDQVLKTIEKAVAAAGEEAITNPLAGVADTVSVYLHALATCRWDHNMAV